MRGLSEPGNTRQLTLKKCLRPWGPRAHGKIIPSGTEVQLPSGDGVRVHPSSFVDEELSPAKAVNKGCCDL